MIALLKYNSKIYLKYNKFMVPFIFYLLFQLIYYGTGSVDFVSDVTICVSVVFCIMTWMGFGYCELQDWRTEQIVFLKINNGNLYWISKIAFMFIIGILLSLIGVIWPLVSSLNNDGIRVDSIVLGFLILILSAFMGVLLGMIFQTRIIGNSNKSILILFLIIIITIVKIPIVNECPIMKTFMWILPPVSNITSSCINAVKFSLNILMMPIVYSITYIFVGTIVYIGLMKKILF
ncbi:hypothetical protein UT300005_13170 [Clostridium sp. CTA-5]